MIDLTRQKECTGCGACVSICPTQAIRLQPDECGFLYPHIDPRACIDCSACNTVCQMEKGARQAPQEQAFYALVNQNQEHLKVSSSGGAFLAVAEYVFFQGGAVVGCAFDEDLKAIHTVTHSLEACIQKLCGSKYVQSETGSTYSEVRQLLKSGRLVLYTGTPCQIEGLLLYLGKKPDNLITMDLICHGVSSPLLWKKHKEHLEKQAGGKLRSYRFRDKEKAGLALYHYRYQVNKKHRHGPAILDRYYTDFLKGFNHRESCYQCRYASLDRVSDLTMGDFWGVQKQLDGLNPRKGVSLLAVNSRLGHQVVQAISHRVTLKQVDKDSATADNHRLVTPTARPASRDGYYRRCFSDFEGWEREYTHTTAWRIAKLNSRVPVFVKRLLGR